VVGGRITANPVINAVAYVCEAEPGIGQTSELPLLTPVCRSWRAEYSNSANLRLGFHVGLQVRGVAARSAASLFRSTLKKPG
jgi:hypothetical protein